MGIVLKGQLPGFEGMKWRGRPTALTVLRVSSVVEGLVCADDRLPRR